MREKSEEADPHEASREHVQAEATEELGRADRHQARRAAVRVVLPAKRDLVIGDVDEPMIPDRRGQATTIPKNSCYR